MKYAFKGKFIQATAETGEENLALMALRGQPVPAGATRLSSKSYKVWQTRRERYGKTGTRKGRLYRAADGKEYKSKGAYNKHLAAMKRWAATPAEKKEQITRRLIEARRAKMGKKPLVALAGKIPASWLEA